MKLTIEELRKVYEDDRGIGKDAALLAVARFVAERQRAVEPTEEMADAVEDDEMDLAVIYRAMSAVAPLVVPDVPTVREE